MAISSAEEIKLSKSSNRVIGIEHRDSTFMYFMKKVLNLTTTFKKEYNYKFFTTSVDDTVKHMTGSTFLTGMNVQFCYRDTLVANKRFRHYCILALIERMNAEDAGLKCLKIFICMTLRCRRRP